MPFTIKCMNHIIRLLNSPLMISIFFMLVLNGHVSNAAEIELPEEELAKESVLPVFDKTVVVRNRAVTLTERFEVSANLGLNLLEPFYTNAVYGFGGAYHFDEMHGVAFSGMFLQTELTSNAKALQAGEGLTDSGQTFDASKAPTVDSMLFASYQLTAYYGKVSLTKNRAMNLSLYGLLGGGLVNWSDHTELALNAGLGQKLYITPNVALRADLNMAIYQGPDITSKELPATGPSRESDYFDDTIYFRTFLTVGLAYLF